MSAGLNDLIRGGDRDIIIGRFIRLNPLPPTPELEIVAAPRHEVPSRFGDQQ